MAYKLKSNVKSLCNNSALPNLKSGGKMISSDKGSSNYMKEGPLYAKEDIGKPGSPAKALKPEIINFFSNLGANTLGRLGTKVGKGNRTDDDGNVVPRRGNTIVKKQKTGSTKIVDDSMRRKVAPNSNSSTPSSGGKSVTPTTTKTSAGSAPTVKSRKKVESVGRPGKASDTTVRKTGGGMTGTKVKVSPEIKTSGKTTEGIKDVKAKKASEPKEMSRKQIREAKKKDKDSGMSRKEVRLNKTKRKAASTRAKTVSKETAAKGGKEAQRLARKTIRLEKKAAKIEGRVKASKIK
jgi:hypothetical protein